MVGTAAKVFLLLTVLGQQVIAQSTESGRQDVTEIIKKQEECIQTPLEYLAAFESREARCVSENLIARISSGSSVDDLNVQVKPKPASFFGGHDALEKYLRVGYPEVFGYNLPSETITLSDPDFPGLQTDSSGFSMLQQIGYPAEYIDINKTYALGVFDKKAIDRLVGSKNASQYPFNADIGPLQPTWRAVKEFYEWVYNDLNLTISDAAIDLLEDTGFNTLTGCPVKCAYALSDFPSENALAPVTTSSRVDYDSCPPPAPNAVEIYPSAADHNSDFCKGYQGRDWKMKAKAMSAPFTSESGCDPAETITAAKILADELSNTTDTIEQAQWLRAFLLQDCAGDFNPLFSGNGFTYTGLGGLLTPAGTEYIVSPFNISSLGENEYSKIYFCINGLNEGRPDENGRCPIPPMEAAMTQATSEAAPGFFSLISVFAALSMLLIGDNF